MSRRAALVASLLALPAQASSVLVVAENDLARDAASDVMETFGQAKVKVKLAGPQAPAMQCLLRASTERARCLAQAGETAFVEAVLLIGAAASKGRTTVTLSLLSTDEGRLLKREIATGPSDNLGPVVKPVAARFARLIKPAKAPRKPEATATTEARESPEPKPVVVASSTLPTTPQPPPDAPAEVTLTPSPSAPEATAVTPMPVRSDGLKVAAWTVTGLGVAAAGAAATFAALGLSARAQLEREDGGVSPWSRSQANALAARANLSFTVALGTAIGAGVLAVLSAILWSQVP